MANGYTQLTAIIMKRCCLTEVRALVKTTYYDYTISHIDEIHLTEQSNTIYLVLIEDDKTFKTIRVCDGEMEEIHELVK